MCIQVVQDDQNNVGFRMNFIYQPFHVMGKALHGVTFGNAHLLLTGQWFKCNTQIPQPIAFVLAVIALDLPVC